MWLMNFLPDWIFHAILLMGVLGLIASLVLKFIPAISTYNLPIQVGAILLIAVGVWFEGAMSNQAEWEAKVKDLEVRMAQAEAKSAETKTVKQLELVRTRGDDIIKYVDREVAVDKEVIKFVENCPIPQIIIGTHNAAALNQPIEANK
jgi:hypothetical protein